MKKRRYWRLPGGRESHDHSHRLSFLGGQGSEATDKPRRSIPQEHNLSRRASVHAPYPYRGRLFFVARVKSEKTLTCLGPECEVLCQALL